jgi:hypothetical protein
LDANGNKENSKKLNNESIPPNSHIQAAAAPKVSLKAREFGREITNAASSSNNGGFVKVSFWLLLLK